MKNKFLFVLVLAGCVLTFGIACKKDYLVKTPAPAADSSFAYIKIADISPSFRSMMKSPDTFTVYLDSTRLSTPLSYGVTFPNNAGTVVNAYAAIPPGTHKLRISFKGTTTADSTITSFTESFTAARYYTFMITDSLLATRDTARMFIQDYFPAPLTGTYNLRFINAVINDTPGLAVDLYSTRKNANLFTKIKPDSVTSFQALAYNAQLNDTIFVRRSGTTFNLAVVAKAGGLVFTPGNQRSYTICFQGNGTLTTGTKARSLVGYVNY